MEVLDVKAPSEAECRVIYYSCECRVHASRFETSSVLPFCPWLRALCEQNEKALGRYCGEQIPESTAEKTAAVSSGGIHQAVPSLCCVSLQLQYVPRWKTAIMTQE